jgi:glycosyltransferase involved in cell wall biosynthesis
MRIGLDTLIENPRRPSSAIHYLQQLIANLATLGREHDFFVFVSPANRELFRTQAPNLHYVPCAASNENIPLRIFSQQVQHPRLARRLRLDVIHGLNQIPLFAPCATVVKICTLHHHEQPAGMDQASAWQRLQYRVRRAYRRTMHDGSARRATLVMANSEATRQAIVQHMGVPPERVRVVYEAVDEAFGAHIAAPAAREHVRRTFGQSRDYVLFVSQLFAHKNPEGAIRAFSRQREVYGDDLDLLFVGRDVYGRVPELTKLANERGVSERVKFLGNVAKSDLTQLYAGARVFFYPSLNETFGKPLVEAMRSGTPIVTADCSCMPEIVGPAGVWADPQDDEALAAALHQVAGDEALRSRLREAGRVRACDFSWEQTVTGTLAMCAEAVDLQARSRKRS